MLLADLYVRSWLCGPDGHVLPGHARGADRVLRHLRAGLHLAHALRLLLHHQEVQASRGMWLQHQTSCSCILASCIMQSISRYVAVLAPWFTGDGLPLCRDCTTKKGSCVLERLHIRIWTTRKTWRRIIARISVCTRVRQSTVLKHALGDTGDDGLFGLIGYERKWAHYKVIVMMIKVALVLPAVVVRLVACCGRWKHR